MRCLCGPWTKGHLMMYYKLSANMLFQVFFHALDVLDMKAMTEQASLNWNVVGERTEYSDFNGILLPISCHAPMEEPENQTWMMIQTYVDCGELFLTYPGNRICPRNSPPLYTTHTHSWQGVFVLQMAVLIYEQTQLVTNSYASFGLWTERASVILQYIHQPNV